MTLSALVVDDILENRQYFQRILMQLGTYTLLADSAESGLKVVANQQVDVIFLDYTMPGMNGFEFIEVCRELPAGLTIPIIMISTDLAINEFAVSQGLAQAWLVKRPTKTMVESALRTLGVIK